MLQAQLSSQMALPHIWQTVTIVKDYLVIGESFMLDVSRPTPLRHCLVTTESKRGLGKFLPAFAVFPGGEFQHEPIIQTMRADTQSLLIELIFMFKEFLGREAVFGISGWCEV